ncbi:SWIM zinc finger family protein, partial [Parafrankia sp. Ea1.12]|uniref:SWIM zinc finger family protein n=1 Tax=Parafrankia sp. Ea1.12 TaxID=573499 RepID=UPI00190FB23C
MSNTTSPPVERGQALALAPDQASVKAGERLAVAGSWPLAGGDAEALWGECRGSGKSPYRVVVALADHASKCSCPSRKFPCKHALGLMLLAAAGGVAGAGGGRPPWAAEWLDRRVARFAAAASAGTRAATGPESERSAAGAARREASRAAKVDAGVAELARWLSDLAGEGLGAAQARPADWWRAAAARMVDAQAPGLAEMIHEAAQIAGSAARRPDWPSRLVDRVGLLHLLCEGWARRADLPADVVAVLRDRIGFTVPVATVLAGEHVVGEVDVLGAHEFGAGRA